MISISGSTGAFTERGRQTRGVTGREDLMPNNAACVGRSNETCHCSVFNLMHSRIACGSRCGRNRNK